MPPKEAITECIICDEKVPKPIYKKHKDMCELKFIAKIDHTVFKRRETPLYCLKCDYKAFQKRYIVDHIRSEHLNMTVKCDKCNVESKSKRSLNSHVKNYHNELRLSSCDQCDYVTRTPRCLTNHREKTHNGLLFKCKKCKLRFKTKNTRTRHMKIHRTEIGEITDTVEKEEGELEEEDIGQQSSVLGKNMVSNAHILYEKSTYVKGTSNSFMKKIHLNTQTTLKTSMPRWRWDCLVCGSRDLKSKTFKHIQRNHMDLLFPCKHCKTTFR